MCSLFVELRTSAYAFCLPWPLLSQLILLAYASFQALFLTATSHCSKSGGQCIAGPERLGECLWEYAHLSVYPQCCLPSIVRTPNSECIYWAATAWYLNSVQMGRIVMSSALVTAFAYGLTL